MFNLVGTLDLGEGFRITAPGLTGRADLCDAAALRFGALEEALVAHTASVRAIEVTPRSVRELRGPLEGAAADPFLQLEVTPGPGQGAVLLVQDELGVLSWHAPCGVRAGTGGRLTFQVPVTAARSPLLGSGGWLKKVLKVAFFDLADVTVGRVGSYLMGRWEADHRPTRLRWFTPQTYAEPCTERDLMTRHDLAALSGQEILLFLHGTLGTSHGAFGGLSQAHLQRLWGRYGGRVLAFDHATLVDSPHTNARRLLESLPPGFSATLDVVCQGRGALVARILADGRFAGAGPGGEGSAGRVRVRRIACSAAEDGSPVLSDADQMGELVDRLTNAMATLPGAGMGGILGDILAALVGAAKLVASGVDPHPGGPPEVPAGWLVRDPLDRRVAIPSDLQPSTRLLALVRGFIADGTADWVFGSDENGTTGAVGVVPDALEGSVRDAAANSTRPAGSDPGAGGYSSYRTPSCRPA